MPTPVVVHLDTDERILDLAEATEFLHDLQVIFAFCMTAVRDDSPDAEPFDIYLSRVRVGSLWVELIAHPDTAESAKAVAAFIAALTGTPMVAALPQRIRAQWYRRAAEAEAAKLAYERARRKGQIYAAQGRLQEAGREPGRRAGRGPGIRRQRGQQS